MLATSLLLLCTLRLVTCVNELFQLSIGHGVKKGHSLFISHFRLLHCLGNMRHIRGKISLCEPLS